MKLSVSAYRAHSSAHKKILSNSYQSQLNYGSTAASTNKKKLFSMDTAEFTSIMDPICPDVAQNREYVAGSTVMTKDSEVAQNINGKWSNSTSRELPAQRKRRGSADDRKHAELEIADWTKSNQRWMKLRTTVQISSAIQKKTPLKREDSFLKRFSTRQIPEAQETVEDSGSESTSGDRNKDAKRRRRYLQKHRYVVNPDENFYFYWLMALTLCILYNFWTLIVRQSFPELQEIASRLWLICDSFTDIVFVLDIVVQLRTGYLEQGLMVYDDKKLASHYIQSKAFLLDIASLLPLDILQLSLGQHPLLRFPRFLKVYRSIKFYYIVESRTVWPNLWRVVNLIHILLILAHWFGCFYFLLSEAEGFQGDWVYPHRPGDYATLSRKYLGSLYWSTLTLTTIGDLPTPETNTEHSDSADGPRSLPRRGLNSRLLRYKSNYGYIFTIVSYLIGVFIFATIVGQVGNVITNRNANRLEYERLLDGAKTYMRHHKVPGGMKRRVLRWYDYSWSRGRIQGGGDINTALGLLPDKLKTELALHVNLSVLKKVTIFQECQPEFLHDLVLKMKAYIFTPGDSICRKGEVAREMFIIADGILEVLSETGKILTTMKAGDFFGEIGILNLDGLNKRTADVRSVGYSELFSLSREDVLTAMKDYPEAQDILQTLGRKRLMEVRSVNKKLANSTKEKNSFINQSGQNHNSEKSAKRIVEKLKFDVKGIKTALRKTRTCRRSDESLETQPLQRRVSIATKAVLTRMPHVESGELFVYDEDRNRTIETPSSPLGAGLPLLHRLRLLKQKQDCEEQATQPLKSSPQAQLISSLSLQQLIQEEPDRLIIGSGLPLLDRLKLLKAKEERIATESYINEIVTKNSSIKSDPLLALSIPSTIPEQNSKVSFKDRFKNTIQQPRIKEATMNDNGKDLWTTGNSLRKNSKTADSEIKDKFKNCQLSENEQSIKPWSKLKSATVLSSSSYVSLSNISNNKEEQESTTEFTTINKLKAQRNLNLDCSKRRLGLSPETFYRKSKHYKTIDDLSPEYRNLTFVQKLRILNERQKLAEHDTATRPRSCSLDYPDKSNAIKISELLFLSQNDVSKSPSRISKKLSITPVPITPQNYRSPESNETIERRELKSILKQMHKDKSTAMVSKNFSQELKGLMTAPTIDGYVARHSKLLKSVTFNSICSSPPNGHSAERNDNFHKFSCIPASPIGKNSSGSNQSIRNNIYSSHESVEMQSYNNKSIVLDAKEFQEPDVPDYFNNVVIDIKNIMRSHMLDIHNQSQQRFAQLKYEVQKRDDIIKQLQTTIEELKANELSLFHKSDSICTVSSDENFMKEESGDSMLSVLPTTIFNRGDKEYISHKLYRCSDQFELRNSDQNSIVNSHTYRDFVISNLTRNVTDMSNIRLEMSNSSLQKCTDNKNEEGDKLYCDDWEVRMLAAELDKRDSITGTYSKYEKNVTKLHTPMKHNTSKLKCRGHNVSFRPRSVSLDQCILNDDIAVFPSISFKRDKERL